MNATIKISGNSSGPAPHTSTSDAAPRRPCSPAPKSLKAEHPKLYKVFDKIDADNSGKISRDELVKHFMAHVKTHGNQLSEETVRNSTDHLLQVVDANRSATIDFREFVGAFHHVESPTSEKIVNEWISRAGVEWYFGGIDATLGSAQWWRLFVAGGVGALTSRIATAPFERVRLIMQAKGHSAGGALAVARQIMAREGFAAFWRSNVAAMLQVVPHGATICLCYGGASQALSGALQRKLTFYERVALGGMAGVAATFVTHPLELIRTRMAVEAAPGAAHAARGIPEASTPTTLKPVNAAARRILEQAQANQQPAAGMGFVHSSHPVRSGVKVATSGPGAAATGGPLATHAGSTMPLAKLVPGTSAPSVAGRQAAPAGLPAAAEPTAMPLVRSTATAAVPAAEASKASGAAARQGPTPTSWAGGQPNRGMHTALWHRGAVLPRAAAAWWHGTVSQPVRDLSQAVVGGRKAYANVADAASRIWRKDGVAGFYRGIAPALVGAAAFTSIMQAAFDTFVAEGRSPSGLMGMHWQAQDMYLTCTAGLAAGAVAQAAVHPIDTVKRRMMLLRMRSAVAQAPWRLATRVLHREGWRALYAGVSPALLNVAPAVMINLGVRELVLGRARLTAVPSAAPTVQY